LLGKGESTLARADINEAVLIDPSLGDVVERATSKSKVLLGEDADGKQ
jgi:hypothetical protein